MDVSILPLLRAAAFLRHFVLAFGIISMSSIDVSRGGATPCAMLTLYCIAERRWQQPENGLDRAVKAALSDNFVW